MRSFLIGAVGYPLLELAWRGHTHPSMALAGGMSAMLGWVWPRQASSHPPQHGAGWRHERRADPPHRPNKFDSAEQGFGLRPGHHRH